MAEASIETLRYQNSALEDSMATVDRGSAPPATQGGTKPAEAHEAVTAQAVAVKRDHTNVLNQLKALAQAAGEDYVYRIPFKDNKSGRTTYAEGPTIKLANDLARIYGNCQVDIREVDEGDAWIFYARFTDLETGFNITRPFRQRKGQNTGMKDDDRRLDSIYQIGASKAIRNVVINALQTMADFAVREAKSGIRKRVEEKPEAARIWIRQKLQEMGIDESRVTAVIGNAPDSWTVPDMARLYSEIKSIEDGMANAEDLFPRQAKRPEDFQPGGGQTGDKQEPEGPAPEPEPDQSGSTPEEAPADPGITLEYVIGALRSAQDEDSLAEYLDMARELPEEEQEQAQAVYRERLAQLQGGGQGGGNQPPQESEAPAEVQKREPIMNPQKAIGDDAITCLICGQSFKTLTRHLGSKHQMRPEQYREAFGLSADYPMKAAGLEQGGQEESGEPAGGDPGAGEEATEEGKGLGERLAQARRQQREQSESTEGQPVGDSQGGFPDLE
ncbi:MAG: MucR family transcriptional regulator [Thiohalorhabdus sp.]